MKQWLKAATAIFLPLLAVLLSPGCSGGSPPANSAAPPPRGSAVSQTAALPDPSAPSQAGFASPVTTAASPPASQTRAAPTVTQTSELLVTREQSLMLRDLRSGKERTLVSAGNGRFISFPAWSPDGSRILYVLVTPAPAAGASDWGSDLYVAAADGADRRLLIEHDAPGVQIASPSWSADGRSILYTYLGFAYDRQGALQGTVNQARRLDLDRGERSTVVDDAADASVCASGRQMVYVRFDRTTGSRAALVVADGNGDNPTSIVTPTAEAQAFLYPQLSPDCRQIVFAAANASGVRQYPQGQAPLIAGLLNLLQPAVAEAHVSPWELWSVNVDGSNLKRLTRLAEDEPYPAWSADGRTIIFLGTNGLYEMDAGGTKLHKIGDGTAHGQIAWRQTN